LEVAQYFVPWNDLPRLTIVAALRRAGRRDLEGKATMISTH
jgi:hypothetical protein